MAAAEDALVAREEEELRRAIQISKREAEERVKQENARAKAEKKLRQEEEKRIAEVDRMRESAHKLRDAGLVTKRKGGRGKVRHVPSGRRSCPAGLTATIVTEDGMQ